MPELKYIITGSDDGSLEKALRKANRIAAESGNALSDAANKGVEGSKKQVEAKKEVSKAVKDELSETTKAAKEIIEQGNKVVETIQKENDARKETAKIAKEVASELSKPATSSAKGNAPSTSRLTEESVKQSAILSQISAKYKSLMSDGLDAFDNLSASTQRQYQRLSQLTVELNRITAAQKDLASSYEKGGLTQKEYLEGSRALSVQENETKNRIAQLSAEIKRNDEIERASIGSIAQKTAKLTQLENEYKSLSEAQRNNELVGGKLRKEYQAITKEVDELNQELSGTKSQGVGSILTNLKGIAAAAGIAFGSQQLISFGTELFEIAKKAEGVAIAFARIGSESDLEKLRVATKGTVDDLQLMQAAVRASNFKIPLDVLGRGLEFAKQRAADTGQEVDYLVNSFVDGVGRKSALVLDNLGISAADLQAEMKKTGDFAQAAGNIIQREMEGGGDAVDLLATKTGRLAATWANFKMFLSEMFSSNGLNLNRVGELTQAGPDLDNKVYTERVKLINQQQQAVKELTAQIKQMESVRNRDAGENAEIILRKEELMASINILKNMREQNKAMNEQARINKGILSNDELKLKISEKRAEADAIIVADASDEKRLAALNKEILGLQELLNKRNGSNDKRSSSRSVKAAEQEAKERRRILDQVADVNKEYTRRGLNEDAQQIQAVKDKYAKIRKTIEEFNARTKGERISIDGLSSDEDRAISDLRYRQETDRYFKTLESQKAAFTDFENFKKQFGENAAQERYAADLEGYKSYTEKLTQEIESMYEIVGKRDLTGPEQDRLKELLEIRKRVQEEEFKKQNAIYQQAYKAALTQSQKLEQVERNYQESLKSLGSTASSEQKSALEQSRKESIDAINDEAAQKLDIFKQLYDDLDYMAEESARNVIKQAQNQLDKLVSDGKISAKLAKQIRRDLLTATDSVNQRLPDGIKEVASSLQNVASGVTQIDEEFGSVLNTLSNVLNSVSQIQSSLDLISKSRSIAGIGGTIGSATGILGLAGAGVGIIGGIVSAFSEGSRRAAQAAAEQFQYTNNLSIKQTEAVTKALQRQLDLVQEVYGTDRIARFNKAISDSEAAFNKNAQTLAGKYQLTDDIKVNEIIELYNQTGKFLTSMHEMLFREAVKGGYIKSIEVAGLTIKSTAEELEQLQRLLDEGKLDEVTSSLAQSLLDQAALYRKALNDLRAELTGTSIESIADEIVSMFEQGTVSAKEFADNFEAIMRKAILNTFKQNLLQKELQKFYEEFAEASEDGLSSSEVDKLREDYNKIIQNAQKQFEELGKIGVDLTSDDQNGGSSLSGTIGRAITEDTANKWMGVQLNIYTLAKSHFAEAQAQSRLMQAHISIAQQNLNAALGIERNTAGTWGEMKNAVSYLVTIANNTKPQFDLARNKGIG